MECDTCRKLEAELARTQGVYVGMQMQRWTHGGKASLAERQAHRLVADAQHALSKHRRRFCSRTLANRLSVGLKVGILRSTERSRFEA